MTAPGKRQKAKGNSKRNSLVLKDDQAASRERKQRDELLRKMKSRVQDQESKEG